MKKGEAIDPNLAGEIMKKEPWEVDGVEKRWDEFEI